MRESRFCDGWNISTIIAEDLNTEDIAYAMILAEESGSLVQYFVHCLEEVSVCEEYYRGIFLFIQK